MSNPGDDPISTRPRLAGKFGRAWEVDLLNYRQKQNIDPSSTIMAIWLVESPFSHMFWHSYAIMLSHLHIMAGERIPNIYLADATHEIVVFSLDIDQSRQKLLDGDASVAGFMINPVNFASQFIATDNQALVKIENSVKEIIQDGLSPDTDQLNIWGQRYGFNMLVAPGKHVYQ